MKKFKSGDKVTLNCSVGEFKENVVSGGSILKENFSADLIATVCEEGEEDFLLEEVVEGSGKCSIYRGELQYLKLVEEIKPTTVQPKIIQILEYNGNLLGLGGDGVVYVNKSAKWEVY